MSRVATLLIVAGAVIIVFTCLNACSPPAPLGVDQGAVDSTTSGVDAAATPIESDSGPSPMEDAGGSDSEFVEPDAASECDQPGTMACQGDDVVKCTQAGQYVYYRSCAPEERCHEGECLPRVIDYLYSSSTGNAALAGCGFCPDTPIELKFFIDEKSFDLNDCPGVAGVVDPVGAAREGALVWSEQTGNRVTMTETELESSAHIIVRCGDAKGWCNASAAIGCGVELASCSDVTGMLGRVAMVDKSNTWSEQSLRIVVAHEVGHNLGVGHTNGDCDIWDQLWCDGGAIMCCSLTINSPGTPTLACKDLQALDAGLGGQGCNLSTATRIACNDCVNEICNGIDDDCDGVIDQGLTRSCQSPCGSGTETCEMGTWVGCDAPPQICQPGAVMECYTGPAGTEDVGECESGERICSADGCGFGPCGGESLPQAETFNNLDDDCNGIIDDGYQCEPGTTASCYTGPTGTAGKGICDEGTKTCFDEGQGTVWGPCEGETVPKTEECDNDLDDDCDGEIDEGCEPPPATCAYLDHYDNSTPPNSYDVAAVSGVSSYVTYYCDWPSMGCNGAVGQNKDSHSLSLNGAVAKFTYKGEFFFLCGATTTHPSAIQPIVACTTKNYYAWCGSFATTYNSATGDATIDCTIDFGFADCPYVDVFFGMIDPASGRTYYDPTSLRAYQ